jgi:hypothetical protein
MSSVLSVKTQDTFRIKNVLFWNSAFIIFHAVYLLSSKYIVAKPLSLHGSAVVLFPLYFI